MLKKWSVFVVIYLCTLVTYINQAKIAPIADSITQQFNVNMEMAGWFMSIFGLTAVVLALPSAYLLDWFGTKKSGIISMGCMALGSVIGALAVNAPMMLIGRLLEGVSMGVLVVIAPTILAQWFKPQEFGIPMAVWSTAGQAGMLVVFNIAAPVFTLGWQAIWWIGAALSVLCAILYAWAVEDAPGIQQEKAEKINISQGFKTPATWVLAGVLFTFCFAVVSENSWFATYLKDAVKLDEVSANFYASLTFTISLPVSFLAGLLFNVVKMKYHKPVFIAFGIGAGILISLVYSTTASTVLLWNILFGIIGATFMNAIFIIAPQMVKSPALFGAVMAVVTFGQNVAVLITPPITGRILESLNGNWSLLNIPNAIAMVLCIVLCFLMKPEYQEIAPVAREAALTPAGQ